MNNLQNIAVVGAGIMGLCVTDALRAADISVSIFEENPNTINASAMAGGMLAPYGEIEHMPQSWLDACFAGLDFWRGFDGDTGFQQNGSIYIAHEQDFPAFQRFKTHIPEEEIDSINFLQDRFSHHLFLPKEAHLNPTLALNALKSKVQNNFVAERFLFKESGDFDLVIDCRGMGAKDDLPDLRGVKGESVVVRNNEFSLPCPVRIMHPRYPLYIVPQGDGVFMIGATNIESFDSDKASLRSAMELMSAAYSLHPSFGDAEILEIRSGVRPAFPDNLPRIIVEGNIIRCNGLFRHGYLLAPVMAECVRDFILGKTSLYSDLFMGKQSEAA